MSNLPLPYSNDPAELQRVLKIWAGHIERMEAPTPQPRQIVATVRPYEVRELRDRIDSVAGTVDAINDDDTLTIQEKRILVPLIDGFRSEANEMEPKVAALGITTEWTNYITALDNLTDFLDGFGTGPLGVLKWRDFTSDLFLGLGGGKTLRTLRDAYHAAYGALRAQLWFITSEIEITAELANSTAVQAAQDAPKVVNGLPAMPNALYPNGKLVYDTVTKRLYRSTGSGWESATIAAGDIVGQLTSDQIQALIASKISGQLTSAQIASLDAAKIAGTITDAQIGTMSASKLAGQIQAAQIAALEATKITGTLTDAQIAGLAAAKLTGTLASSQLGDGIVDAAKLAAGVAGDIEMALQQSIIGDGTTKQFLYGGGSVYRTDWQGTQLLYSTARTNNSTYCRQYDNAAWNKGRCTITADAAVAPDGTMTADALVEDSTSNSHPVYRTYAGLVSGQVYTYTQDIQAAGRTQARMATGNTAFVGAGYVDLDFSAVTATGNAGATGTIVALPRAGWYRCTLTVTASASGSGDTYVQPRAAGTALYLGTGITALYLGDADFKADSGTSVIPGVAATAVTVTDYAVANGVVTFTAAPAVGVVVRGVATNAATQAIALAPAIVAALPALPSPAYPQGKLAILTTDNKVYRSTGPTWTSATDGADITAASIVAASIAAGAIGTNQLAANAVTAAKIAANTITAAQIAAGTITAASGIIADATIGTAKIIDAAITTAKIANLAVGTAQIADAAIVDAKIGSLDAGKINTGYLSAARIAAASIGADAIAANSIYTKHLVVTDGGANILPDSSGVDPTGWADPGLVLTGIADLAGATTALANPVGVADFIQSVPVRIDHTKNYLLSMYVKTLAGSGGLVYLLAKWYDANLNFLASNGAQPAGAGTPAGWGSGTYSYFGLIGATPASSWTRYAISMGPSSSAVIPSNARYVAVGMLANWSNMAGYQVAMSRASVVERSSAELIVDGAIIAQKIAAGAVTTDKMSANSIDGDRILANSLNASKIMADTITAGQIQAGAIGADEVAANAIMAKHLVVANFDNLIPNGNCEATPPAGGWPAGAWEAVGLSSGYAYAGTNYRQASGWTYLTPELPCKAGESFYYEAMGASMGQAQVGLRFLDGAGNPTHYESQQPTPGGVWTKISTQGTAPTGTVSVSCYIGGVGSSNYIFDNLYCRRMADANLIVDGTLQALFARIGKAITSTNYSPGGVATPPTGFCISSTVFSTTFRDGSTDANCLMELGGTANINGYKAGVVTGRTMTPFNRIINFGGAWAGSTTYARLLSGNSGATTYYPSGSTYDATTGSQGFNLPSHLASVMNLKFTPSASLTTGSTGTGNVTFRVTVSLYNNTTGTTTQLYQTTQTLTNATPGTTQNWAPGQQSINVASYLSADPGGYAVKVDINNIRLTNDSFATGANSGITATLSVGAFEILA